MMSGELENAGKRGPGGEGEKMDGLRGRGSSAVWHRGGLDSTAALDPAVWYSTVRDGGSRFMAAWVKEKEKASEHRQRKREADEADQIEVAPGVTLASLRRFRAALIGPTQLPKQRLLWLYRYIDR